MIDTPRLHYIVTGRGGITIVLLHGMAGSTKYWDSLAPYLETCRVIRIDLLGFGRSPKPNTSSYNIHEHVAAVYKTLVPLLEKNKKATVVGHSMGALIGVAFSQKYPHLVKKLILISMPLYDNPQIAKQHVVHAAFGSRLMLYGWSAWSICWLMCHSRWLARLLAPLYLPHVPRQVAKDVPLHTWASYSRSLKNIIEDQSSYLRLKQIKTPTVLLYGSEDEVMSTQDLSRVPENFYLTVKTLPGSHQLPIEKPREVADVILPS